MITMIRELRQCKPGSPTSKFSTRASARYSKPQHVQMQMHKCKSGLLNPKVATSAGGLSGDMYLFRSVIRRPQCAKAILKMNKFQENLTTSQIADIFEINQSRTLFNKCIPVEFLLNKSHFIFQDQICH